MSSAVTGQCQHLHQHSSKSARPCDDNRRLESSSSSFAVAESVDHRLLEEVLAIIRDDEFQDNNNVNADRCSRCHRPCSVDVKDDLQARTCVCCSSYTTSKQQQQSAVVALEGCWREKVVQWYYDVIDHYDADRSIVYIAMKLLDRFWTFQPQEQVKHGHDSQTSTMMQLMMDHRTYQISSMSALFTAFRLFDDSSNSTSNGSMSLRELAYLSGGTGVGPAVSADDIVRMGMIIVQALSSRSNGSCEKNTHRRLLHTPRLFLQLLVELVPCVGQPEQRQRLRTALLEDACYLADLSVYDVYLSRCEPSTIALSALLTAIAISGDSNSRKAEIGFASMVHAHTDVNILTSKRIVDVRDRFLGMYHQSSLAADRVGDHNREGDDYQQQQQQLIDEGPHLIEEDDDGDVDVNENETMMIVDDERSVLNL